jgi:hypothetical protein
MAATGSGVVFGQRFATWKTVCPKTTPDPFLGAAVQQMNGQNSNMTRTVAWRAAWSGCVVLLVLLACLWWNAEVQQVMPPRSVEHREQDSATTATDVDSVEPSEEDEPSPSEELQRNR